jgi:hypothetical protein
MYTPSIVIDQVIDALAAFVVPLCPGYEIVRAQVNRVSMPVSPCIVLTELLTVDLETPVIDYDGTLGQASISGPKRIDVQIDYYGPGAGDQCNAVKTVFRTPYATEQFPTNIQPLYCSDGLQTPLITGEQQWQSRFTSTASLQYNPVVIVPQDSADEASMGTVGAADI